MAARKKDKEENEVYLFTLDDPQQNEDERGSFQPLLKTNSEAAERNPSRTANVLRRLDERRTDGVENRSRWLARARSSSAPGPASPGPASLCLWNGHQAADRVAWSSQLRDSRRQLEERQSSMLFESLSQDPSPVEIFDS